MAFYNKIKWVLGILMVFVLIITTNLIDRNNFVRVKDSVETIYEDRLIANDLIFEMTKLVQEKELAVATTNEAFFKEENRVINNDIQRYIEQFEQTKLTRKETEVFESLKYNFDQVEKSESSFIASGFITTDKLSTQITDIKQDLYDLSKIQLNEGRRQMSISKKALDTVELFTQMEIYLLVFLAIVIQIIVMYNPKSKKANL
ncbi:MCP four helix bundle domain-containing protein [Nonlabens antarcticus]|uniref:MCP four helix bundle domain-containing protein n=1 Tax=Nonlabens antarcticus TaxID=392714 RepID=UPI001890F30D|nr:MCP four helix bundle domain-containing protein [Nonlabens antarcticus]